MRHILCFLIFLFSGAASAFNAVDLVKDSISTDCLDYCLEGACFYLYCTGLPPSCRVHVTPRISYKQPDALVMVYPETGKAPWDEWQHSFGKVLSQAEKPLIKALTGTPANGGKTTLPNQGGTAHTLFYRNADVIGHPVSYLFNSLSKGRNRGLGFELPSVQNGSYPTPRDLSQTPTRNTLQSVFFNRPHTDGRNLAKRTKKAIPSSKELARRIARLPANIRESASRNIAAQRQKAKNFSKKVKRYFNKRPADGIEKPGESLIKDFGKFNPMTDKRFSEIVDIESVKQSMSIQKSFGDFSKVAEKIDSVADAFGGSTGGNLFCPSKVLPLNPYFISGLDSMGWRLGFPDRIHVNTWLPHAEVIGDFPNNKWGKIFPRQGFIYGVDESKASAVIAERAMHLVTRSKQNHVYTRMRGQAHQAGKGKWQMLHPDAGGSCKTFGASPKFPFRKSQDGSYAFNYWRKYSCCLNPKGRRLGIVRSPKICF